MRIPNDPTEHSGGPLSELLKLQLQFQTRLVEDTMRYVRQLQGAFAPASPGTVVVPDDSLELRVAGSPGDKVEIALEIENRQRVHSVATPMLTPLVELTGATWFPLAEPTPPSLLLAPGESGDLSVSVVIPGELPPGIYRGGLMLHGFRAGSIPVVVAVNGAGPVTHKPRRKSTRAAGAADGAGTRGRASA